MQRPVLPLEPAALKSVNMSRSLAARLLSEVRKTPAVEVCGFLGGRDGVPCSLYPVANIAECPARYFAMDPAEQIAVFKKLRERGETLYAIYHSHPSAPAEPSVHDLAGQGYPEALVLIISLYGKNPPEIRAWRREDERMREVALTFL
jgi:proteasome lid subunit RPN8/RPN11